MCLVVGTCVRAQEQEIVSLALCWYRNVVIVVSENAAQKRYQAPLRSAHHLRSFSNDNDDADDGDGDDDDDDDGGARSIRSCCSIREGIWRTRRLWAAWRRRTADG